MFVTVPKIALALKTHKKELFTTYLLTLLWTCCTICSAKEAEKTILTGKIAHYDSAVPFSMVLHRLGLSSLTIYPKVNDKGDFYAEIDLDIPTQIWITYRTNFSVVLHPRDSLWVAFDGNTNQRTTLLSAIQFAGTAAVTNTHIAQFQRLYYASELSDHNKNYQAVKNYDPVQYMRFNDSIRQKGKALYEQFVNSYSPNEESKKWALFESENTYYEHIVFYATDHQSANNLGLMDTAFVIPKGFYEKLAQRLPLQKENLANTNSILTFSSFFKLYINEKLNALGRKDSDWFITPSGELLVPKAIADSVVLHSIVDFVSDPLLREIMISHHFSKAFQKQDIKPYEKFHAIRTKYIKSPYLRNLLQQEYLTTKSRVEHPELNSRAIFKEMQSSPVKGIMDDILLSNKRKVIYIDFWATWCAPCLSEFPNSKQIEAYFHNKDVSFVYLCLDSDFDKYKATISRYDLGGQHYFLSAKQSSAIRELFNANGIPFYILIDKDGRILETGNHLRPLSVKDQINKLIQ
ncbi:MAG: TlpA family protein disulfide reductase [Sphingobacterium sp.]|jgi:thiol-disulfide isomerase/thioredoxin|uniref:TlpA family protein disulfide reductase n=1 Tax=Sphingobacterium sp. TaxID=341027 RepID=UPI00283FBCC2|nr:TlpA disulfide reductase family protein [Sphingobacterium sp.]MDR3007090.1 TlpA family protein disulfide reductase [Sphingobacterium sp.]